jgi:hypothetical protein
MVSGDGKYSMCHCYEGHKRAPNNIVKWPNQQNPDKKDWEVWKEWMALLVVNHNNLRLKQPLGRWKGGMQHWRWRWDEPRKTLYKKRERNSWNTIMQ